MWRIPIDNPMKKTYWQSALTKRKCYVAIQLGCRVVVPPCDAMVDAAMVGLLSLINISAKKRSSTPLVQQHVVHWCPANNGSTYSELRRRTRPDSITDGGGAGCIHVMHGRSRMTIDPCIPTMFAGTEHVGFSHTDQADIACTKGEAP